MTCRRGATDGEEHAIGFQFTSSKSEKSQKPPRRAATVHRHSSALSQPTQETTWPPFQEALFHFQLFRGYKVPTEHSLFYFAIF